MIETNEGATYVCVKNPQINGSKYILVDCRDIASFTFHSKGIPAGVTYTNMQEYYNQNNMTANIYNITFKDGTTWLVESTDEDMKKWEENKGATS